MMKKVCKQSLMYVFMYCMCVYVHEEREILSKLLLYREVSMECEVLM